MIKPTSGTRQYIEQHRSKRVKDRRKELGVAVYVDSLSRSIKSQMRHANKMNAKFSVIFDVENLKQNKILDNKTAYYGSREHKDSIIEASIIRKFLGYF